jgi:hypothetical protein
VPVNPLGVSVGEILACDLPINLDPTCGQSSDRMSVAVCPLGRHVQNIWQIGTFSTLFPQDEGAH